MGILVVGQFLISWPIILLELALARSCFLFLPHIFYINISFGFSVSPNFSVNRTIDQEDC